MMPSPGGLALSIQSGAELSQYKPRMVSWGYRRYHLLTGYEEMQSGICWWCGKEVGEGKRSAHFCRGRSHDDVLSCYRIYHDHFDWGYASRWALRRSDGRCENCRRKQGLISWGFNDLRTNLEVHHIVPLQGNIRGFSVFNLPWNLVVLCKDCHLELHAAMKIKSVQKYIQVESTLQGTLL